MKAKKILASFVLFTLLSSCGSTGDEANEGPISEQNIYIHPEGEFQMNYPKDWISAGSDLPHVQDEGFVHSYDGSFVWDESSLQKKIEVTKEGIVQLLSNPEYETLDFENDHGYKITGLLGSNERGFIADIFVIGEDRSYWFSYVGQPENKEKRLEELADIFKTFEYLGEPSEEAFYGWAPEGYAIFSDLNDEFLLTFPDPWFYGQTEIQFSKENNMIMTPRPISEDYMTVISVETHEPTGLSSEELVSEAETYLQALLNIVSEDKNMYTKTATTEEQFPVYYKSEWDEANQVYKLSTYIFTDGQYYLFSYSGGSESAQYEDDLVKMFESFDQIGR